MQQIQSNSSVAAYDLYNEKIKMSMSDQLGNNKQKIIFRLTVQLPSQCLLTVRCFIAEWDKAFDFEMRGRRDDQQAFQLPLPGKHRRANQSNSEDAQSERIAPIESVSG